MQTTPMTAGYAGLGAKRKIADTYPEFSRNYGQEDIRLKVQRLADDSSDKVVAKRRVTKIKGEKLERPPIILRFKIAQGPNKGLHSDLVNAMKSGVIADSENNFRAELLLDNGHLPTTSETLRDMRAFSSTVCIDHAHIRKLADRSNKKNEPDISLSFNLEDNYDDLLVKQIPELKEIPNNVYGTTMMANKVEENKDEHLRVSVIVGAKSIKYLRIKQTTYLVHRTAILIPRLTPEEIIAVTGKPLPWLSPPRLPMDHLLGDDEDSLSGWESVN